MYNDFFELAKNPFAMTPDPGFLMLTPKHREALAGLMFAVNSRKGFVALTGDAGTGKTTLLRKLVNSVSDSRVQFSFVLNPTLTPAEFLESVMLDFGFQDIPVSKALRLVRLQEFLVAAHLENKTSVLVVDEAHKLTPELLEEVRLLTNFETTDQKLLQIILAGQNELVDLLDRQDLRQLKQRVAVRLYTEAISEATVAEYIRIRWRCAGGQVPTPFSQDAIALIARRSRGIPRVINAICDNALTNAFGMDSRTVGASEVMEATVDLHLTDPTPPVATVVSPAPVPVTPVAPAVNGSAAKPQSVGVVEVTPALYSLERYMPRRRPLFVRWATKLGLGTVRG